MSTTNEDRMKDIRGSIGLAVLISMVFTSYVAMLLSISTEDLEDRIQVLEGIHAEQIIEELADQ